MYRYYAFMFKRKTGARKIISLVVLWTVVGIRPDVEHG